MAVKKKAAPAVKKAPTKSEILNAIATDTEIGRAHV